MLSFSAAIQVFLCTVPCDMRRSFDGLSMMAEHIVQANPLSGHLFVYTNRRANRLKILIWEPSGYLLIFKRLERGRFSWPQAAVATARLRGEELIALLTGLEVQPKRGWYRHDSGS